MPTGPSASEPPGAGGCGRAPAAGLSSAVAQRRLAEVGPNAIAETKGPSRLRRFLVNVVQLLALLLWAGAGLALLAGMPQLAAAIVVVILVNAVFSYLQEERAERAVAALRRMLPQRVRIRRDGETAEIPGEEVVPGDVLLLEPGDRVAADAELVLARDLRVDESALTGESTPVAPEREVFAGTYVTAGTAEAVVTATGMGTRFGHIAALAQTLLPPLIKGGRSILEASFDVDRTYDLIESERVTIMFGVPAMFNFIAQSPRWDTADLSSLRNLLCGGAPVPEPLIRRYQERGLTFLQGYGMTETSPGALFLSAEDSVRKAGTAGVPSFFTDVRVVTADGRDAAPGEPGEVIVQGPNVMLGYWNKPEATAEALRDGWFHSGDIAVKDEEGYARIADRLKDMIISGGENIYPAEVEEVLYGHPAVAECAVIGVPDERWGEVGKAIVVLRPGMTATAEEIIKFFDGRLARYKIPKHVEFVDALPRNGSGKILKHVLRERHG